MTPHPSEFEIRELDGTVILALLDHLESVRSNQGLSRNTGLRAFRSFFTCAAPESRI